MKTKNKVVALVEIAIVLCSLFLVALPSIAADSEKVSTTASEDDYTLGIYGNANEDDTIDMRDFTYTARIILWLEEPTDLADANLDGKITARDMTQIGLIILGRESELTIVDTVGRDVTIDKPLERIAVLNWNTLEVMQSLKLEKEKIICVSKSTIGKEIFFPEFKDIPNAGSGWSPDIEKILELEPDVVFLYATHFKTRCDEVQEKLEDAGITVVRFDCFKPEDYLDEVNISGYKVIDKEEVMLHNPEIIVKQGYARGKYGYNTDDITWLQDIRAEITGRIELANVSAVKDKRVYVIIKELTGGKHFIAVAYMAKWLYPELFKGLDPKAIHQEYLTRFQGLDYDLDKHGVFVYHPELHPAGK